ncbi:hypothetical protein ALC57_18964, partial [Trachymyrmex cornetzi]
VYLHPQKVSSCRRKTWYRRDVRTWRRLGFSATLRTGYLPVKASGSRPFFKALCLILTLLSLLQIVLFGFKFDYGLPQFGSFTTELVNRQTFDFQRLDANAKGNFLLLLKLFFRLVTFKLRRRKITLNSHKRILVIEHPIAADNKKNTHRKIFLGDGEVWTLCFALVFHRLHHSLSLLF